MPTRNDINTPKKILIKGKFVMQMQYKQGIQTGYLISIFNNLTQDICRIGPIYEILPRPQWGSSTFIFGIWLDTPGFTGIQRISSPNNV